MYVPPAHLFIHILQWTGSLFSEIYAVPISHPVYLAAAISDLVCCLLVGSQRGLPLATTWQQTGSSCYYFADNDKNHRESKLCWMVYQTLRIWCKIGCWTEPRVTLGAILHLSNLELLRGDFIPLQPWCKHSPPLIGLASCIKQKQML